MNPGALILNRVPWLRRVGHVVNLKKTYLLVFGFIITTSITCFLL